MYNLCFNFYVKFTCVYCLFQKAVKKPEFTQPLRDAKVDEGRSIRLECRYAGDPAPQIQWLFNDAPILPSALFKVNILSLLTFQYAVLLQSWVLSCGTDGIFVLITILLYFMALVLILRNVYRCIPKPSAKDQVNSRDQLEFGWGKWGGGIPGHLLLTLQTSPLYW